MKATCENCRWFQAENILDLFDGVCKIDGMFVDRFDTFYDCWRPLIGGLK